MELSRQIKKYRSELNLSQEELAEKVFVTRQTISNWENEKNYPDIHSLLLLSSLFGISLDQLIKGDVDIMKKEINKEEIAKFNMMANILTVLMALCVFTAYPLFKFVGIAGIIIWVILYGVTMYYAFKVEKIKKDNDISTYKEIVAFMDGKPLDEITKQREIGKRPYQNILKLLAGAAVMVVVLLIMTLIFEGIQ